MLEGRLLLRGKKGNLQLGRKISSGTATLASATDRKNGTSSETVHDIVVLGIIWLINPGADCSTCVL